MTRFKPSSSMPYSAMNKPASSGGNWTISISSLPLQERPRSCAGNGRRPSGGVCPSDRFSSTRTGLRVRKPKPESSFSSSARDLDVRSGFSAERAAPSFSNRAASRSIRAFVPPAAFLALVPHQALQLALDRDQVVEQQLAIHGGDIAAAGPRCPPGAARCGLRSSAPRGRSRPSG